MKKPIVLIGFFVLFSVFFPAPPLFAQSDSVSGSSCEMPGQVSQVCIGARDYQMYECKRASEDECRGILDKKEKLAAGCNDCIPGVVGWLIETCEGRESQRTAAEFEAQCTAPLKQLDEEYSTCREAYAWKATGKGSCSVEGMVCAPQTSAGRRFDVCRLGDAPQQAETEETKTSKPVNPTDTSLLTNAPADTDLGPTTPPAESKTQEKPLTGTINEIDGNIDMRLADGTWVPLKNGDFIPEGATIFAGYDSTAHLKFSNFLEIYLRSLDEVNLEILQNDPEKYRTELKLEDGALRFKVLEPTMKTDMRVSTPNTTASIVGTDFGVAYFKESGLSVWEIYDGTIDVENTHTGEKKTLASSYGSPIRRLEALNDSPMVEEIAIPKNQKGTKLPLWFSAGGIAVLVAGALLFMGRKRVIKGQNKKRP